VIRFQLIQSALLFSELHVQELRTALQCGSYFGNQIFQKW